MSENVYGNVVHPPYVDRLIPDRQTQAWDNLGPTVPYGLVFHSMVGGLVSTDAWFRNGIPSVNHVARGLTHYGVGGSTDGAYDGLIVRWNDPLGAGHVVNYGNFSWVPGVVNGYVSPNRSGWANGGSDGLEGDGPAFVRKFGVNAINRNLVSVERSDGGNILTPMSPRQFEAIAHLTAYWFDWAKVRWDSFPINQNFGIVTNFFHNEFATKNCPFPPVIDRINELQGRIRAILKAGQTGESGIIVPPPGPVEPEHPELPHGWTEKELQARFGVLPRVNPSGSITNIVPDLDTKGSPQVVFNMWIERSAEHYKTISLLPRPFKWWVLQGDAEVKQDIILFERDWALWRPDPAVVWKWIR